MFVSLRTENRVGKKLIDSARVNFRWAFELYTFSAVCPAVI